MPGSLIDIIFPPVCPLCEARLREGALCPDCGAAFSKERISAPFCVRCGIPFASKTSGAHTCGDCLASDVPFEEARSSFVYGGRVAGAIHSFKYGGKVTLAAPFGELAAEAAVFSERPDVVVPVPLHRKRLEARGFNQSLLIARTVAKRLSARLDYLGLRRVRPTDEQVNLKIDERRRNVAGAFAVERPDIFRGKRVLLVDDVLTTGSTVNECSKVLKKAGARVYVATLARAVKV